MEKPIFLVVNQNGNPVKALTSLKDAWKWAEERHYHHDYMELSGITEIVPNGEEWGIHHPFIDEEYQEEYLRDLK